jgi:hypothetical protein
MLLDMALKRGLIEKESIACDNEGLIRMNLNPEKFIGMETSGNEVSKSLVDQKVDFVRQFLSTCKEHIISKNGKAEGFAAKIAGTRGSDRSPP